MYERSLEEYQKFLDENDIRFFRATELVTGMSRGNEPPPSSLWSNIIPTLKMLDRARTIFGRIRINSCYRNEFYNGIVGGARHSKHKLNMACDIVPLDADIEKVHGWLLSNIPDDSWGLRLYKKHHFIHIDCRDIRYREVSQ